MYNDNQYNESSSQRSSSMMMLLPVDHVVFNAAATPIRTATTISTTTWSTRRNPLQPLLSFHRYRFLLNCWMVWCTATIIIRDTFAYTATTVSRTTTRWSIWRPTLVFMDRDLQLQPRRQYSCLWGVNDDSDNNWNTFNSDSNNDNEEDWQKVLLDKQDGTFWSSFEPINDDDDTINLMGSSNGNTTLFKVTDPSDDDDAAAELWLDQLQSLASLEVEFNLQEADRADKARQMEEWGFDRETIRNALGVAIDASLETVDEVQGMQTYREESFWDEVDLTTVESHSQVEMDEETGEPARLQMVYVDEHTCIGCTNCAMIAQSTFFMHPDHGRARVFRQWGDDEETIQIAIETCPVDCIHYIPYDELVSLEKDRRGQNINFKARLVSQAENGNSLSHLSGRGSNAFTAPQLISGNMRSRCNNCPTRGCRTCPMYGVGKNPAYENAEKARKEKIMKRIVQQQRQRDQKTAEL